MILMHENLILVLQLYLVQQTLIYLGVLFPLLQIFFFFFFNNSLQHFDPDSGIIHNSSVLFYTVHVCECECCPLFHLILYKTLIL